jgi:hypothetical protein
MKTGALTILRALSLAAVMATAASARETVFKDDRTLGAPDAPSGRGGISGAELPALRALCGDRVPRDQAQLHRHRQSPLRAAGLSAVGGRRCRGRPGQMPAPERYFANSSTSPSRNRRCGIPDGYVIPDVKAALVQLGGLAGLTPEAVTRCMEDKDEIERVNRIAQDGIDRYHIEAVPSLVIDGKVLLGETEASWPALKTRIDGLLAEAVAPPTPHKTVVHQHGHHKHGHHRHHRHHRHHIKGHGQNTKPGPQDRESQQGQNQLASRHGQSQRNQKPKTVRPHGAIGPVPSPTTPPMRAMPPSSAPDLPIPRWCCIGRRSPGPRSPASPARCACRRVPMAASSRFSPSRAPPSSCSTRRGRCASGSTPISAAAPSPG